MGPWPRGDEARQMLAVLLLAGEGSEPDERVLSGPDRQRGEGALGRLGLEAGQRGRACFAQRRRRAILEQPPERGIGSELQIVDGRDEQRRTIDASARTLRAPDGTTS